MEDKPADPGFLTTGEPEKPRRRMLFGRRRRAGETAEESVPEAASETADADGTGDSEDVPQRRTPMGKSGRKAVTETESESEGETESEAGEEPEPEADAEEAEQTDGETDVEASETEATDAEPADDVVLVPHREAGKRLTYFAAGAAVVFVAAGAFGGAMLQPYLADRALVATKLQVAQTSADAITTLWTYTPDNIESLPDRAAKYLSSDFADKYRKLIDSIVPTNKQAQVSNNTQVMGTAVETIGGDQATAIVYTNTVSTSPVTKNIPSLRYSSYRLTLQRSDGDWLITEMPALTQLDLSPQL
ncbi:mammalian cell entry protein [Mycobacteroides abscessus subsp. abscessus]|uniref:hypothetical protein n=1 Tax=Mycolicibacterium fortuitum TaxID=1766 RepID=UPI0007EB522F|nr:hypothetical protein [Mycolicibacterium fortuitum]MDO3239454.1 mammalian cell entry protein [Mycobacteroides abscessus subsp. abscessus]OBA96175.1 mammalian cell entry protein [Mycolicibacterium fortuitum]